ncbi:3-methyladenine DNA glycosylase/8-oxoguanine DNA glycosylase [Prescottella agglutinans]|uniref:3-methyladenine DNA glycosylase/8-oxoguanine DNA glycosylase n=1 Tax=Prescottella agglutinans TaxID=1644129 RepID=A0ABT6M8A6_9NOCA|nr:3-methyladenine DNA glycosylase/8-oxoguanine DNA glycosylase [Prescottella agglutinans]
MSHRSTHVRFPVSPQVGDRDANPSGDLVLRRALGVKTPREAAAASEPWRPWRAYALFHLWTSQAFL